MLDQASKLRQLANENTVSNKFEKIGTKVITITSGKGGVGKSNIVVNLAITLQKMGKKVLIFDADIGMGNDDVLMGCFPRYSVFDIIFNDKNIEEVIIDGPMGIKLLPGGSALSRVEDLTDIQRQKFLNQLESIQGFDYILMDTGAGINKSILAFISCSDELLIVTTPEPTSLTDAYSLIKAINKFEIKKEAKIIVNRVIEIQDGTITFSKLKNAANKFLDIDLEFLGMITEDTKLIKSVRKQVPVCIEYPKAESTKDIEDIAKKIEGYLIKENNGNIQKLFKRIFNIFS